MLFSCKSGKAETWGGSVSRCYFSHLHALAYYSLTLLHTAPLRALW